MAKEPLRSIKGTHDILPEESRLWQRVEQTIRETMAIYGYQEIRTPAFEKTDLFTRGVGAETDIVTKEMYSWADQGNTSLTLKPEATAPVIRAYVQHNLGVKSPLTKLYYIDALFRRERPQKGRQRQFHQFGVEALGSEYPELDAEIIALAYHILEILEVDELELKLNSIGSSTCREEYRQALQDFLRPYLKELSETSQRRFETNPLRILDTKVPHEIELLRGAPVMESFHTLEDKTHFAEVCSLLSALDIPYVVEPRLVRGLDYYTRTTFEITSPALGAQDALCGGGRYDSLVEVLGGKPTPGIGFAAGMERILMVIGKNYQTAPVLPLLFVIGLGPKSVERTLTLVQNLRKIGIPSVFDPLRRSLKAQLREANKLGADTAIIIGDQELAQDTVQIKDLVTGIQKQVPYKDAVSFVTALPL
ncbi:MAG: histidine--tRNA ligase [Fidelibacterota bacterium]